MDFDRYWFFLLREYRVFELSGLVSDHDLNFRGSKREKGTSRNKWLERSFCCSSPLLGQKLSAVIIHLRGLIYTVSAWQVTRNRQREVFLSWAFLPGKLHHPFRERVTAMPIMLGDLMNLPFILHAKNATLHRATMGPENAPKKTTRSFWFSTKV